MNGKLVILTLAVVFAVSLAFEKMPKIDDKFMTEEVCGEKGEKTLEALEGKCRDEMETLTTKRKEICEDYTKNGLESVQGMIGKLVKAMTPEQKKDLGACLKAAYKKAHGKDFEE